MNVVITGASTGIGRATALQLAAGGHRVFAGVRRPADADALRQGATGELVPLILDVTDPEQIHAARATVADALGSEPLHGLINNAGIGLGGPIEHVSIEDWRTQFEVNVFGVTSVLRELLELLRAGPGRVINVSSVGGRVAQPFLAPYCASKFALEAISDALRIELAPWGIEVSVIEPGAIQTPIWDKARSLVTELEQRLGPAAIERYGDAIDRMSKVIDDQARVAVPPERVADAIEHALTARRPRTRYLVGSDARVGATLKWMLPDRWFDAFLRRAM
ncbi:MAG TPA: SDR family oxidoreductase [Deltaproteobacteria bacterium]|nr:SDR family oxidoreductase [Deltaproteobacteria bacterium]